MPYIGKKTSDINMEMNNNKIKHKTKEQYQYEAAQFYQTHTTPDGETRRYYMHSDSILHKTKKHRYKLLFYTFLSVIFTCTFVFTLSWHMRKDNENQTYVRNKYMKNRRSI